MPRTGWSRPCATSTSGSGASASSSSPPTARTTTSSTCRSACRRWSPRPSCMLAQMTYAGVDHCVLQAGGAYGAMTTTTPTSQRSTRKSSPALMHLDEAMAGTPGGLAEVERGVASSALKGIYYNFDGFARHDFAWALDDPGWIRSGIGSPSSGSSSASRCGGAVLRRGRLRREHPLARPHPRPLSGVALPPGHGAAGAPLRGTAPLGAPAGARRGLRPRQPPDRDDVPDHLGRGWDYPYPEAQALIRDFREKLGAEKMMWGSDMPNVERFCTYRQSLDYVRRYCDFLSARRWTWSSAVTPRASTIPTRMTPCSTERQESELDRPIRSSATG